MSTSLTVYLHITFVPTCAVKDATNYMFRLILINTLDVNLSKTFEGQYGVSKFSILVTVARNSKNFLLEKQFLKTF